jgi:hypothetical protein
MKNSIVLLVLILIVIFVLILTYKNSNSNNNKSKNTEYFDTIVAVDSTKNLYRYYKLIIHKTLGGVGPVLSKVKFYGNGDKEIKHTAKITDTNDKNNKTPTNLNSSKNSSLWKDSKGPFLATNSKKKGGIVLFDFGENYNKTLDKFIKYDLFSDGKKAKYIPIAWSLWGSIDNKNWDLLDDRRQKMVTIDINKSLSNNNRYLINYQIETQKYKCDNIKCIDECDDCQICISCNTIPPPENCYNNPVTDIRREPIKQTLVNTIAQLKGVNQYYSQIRKNINDIINTSNTQNISYQKLIDEFNIHNSDIQTINTDILYKINYINNDKLIFKNQSPVMTSTPTMTSTPMITPTSTMTSTPMITPTPTMTSTPMITPTSTMASIM